MDNTPASRALLAKFEGSGRFEVVATPRNEAEVQSVLDRGEAHAVVRVLPNFARDLQRGRSTEVQILVDGSQLTYWTVAYLGYGSGAIAAA